MDRKVTVALPNRFSDKIYVEQKPYVGEDGIYVPCEPYVPEGCCADYKCIITKELFIEAYNKWIKEGE